MGGFMGRAAVDVGAAVEVRMEEEVEEAAGEEAEEMEMWTAVQGWWGGLWWVWGLEEVARATQDAVPHGIGAGAVPWADWRRWRWSDDGAGWWRWDPPRGWLWSLDAGGGEEDNRTRVGDMMVLTDDRWGGLWWWRWQEEAAVSGGGFWTRWSRAEGYMRWAASGFY